MLLKIIILEKNLFVQHRRHFCMDFSISLTTFQQIQTFVALAAKQPFDIRVGNDRQSINGKDFMGMFSLDYTRPVNVHADCSADAFASFRKAALALQDY